MPRRKQQQSSQVSVTVSLQPNDLQLLSIEQTMKLLNVGRTKLYDLIRREGLPTARIGGSIRIPLLDLKQWIEDHKILKVS